ncbi:Chromatin assembly factor 1 subunit FSM [Frankliniella fusca]|uniref:Chromatin assembly factor 1 subunit FSM n=1 Tax=Frankliniella fusca TaxID=407009 RepID=A0AAE1L9D1_9NEOP|nr:Chromatin assembly factor 1 subunit FSM [Frankliniella fusca]
MRELEARFQVSAIRSMPSLRTPFENHSTTRNLNIKKILLFQFLYGKIGSTAANCQVNVMRKSSLALVGENRVKVCNLKGDVCYDQ